MINIKYSEKQSKQDKPTIKKIMNCFNKNVQNKNNYSHIFNEVNSIKIKCVNEFYLRKKK